MTKHSIMTYLSNKTKKINGTYYFAIAVFNSWIVFVYKYSLNKLHCLKKTRHDSDVHWTILHTHYVI